MVLVVRMAAKVPMGMDFWASFKSPDLLDPAMIPGTEQGVGGWGRGRKDLLKYTHKSGSKRLEFGQWPIADSHPLLVSLGIHFWLGLAKPGCTHRD